MAQFVLVNVVVAVLMKHLEVRTFLTVVVKSESVCKCDLVGPCEKRICRWPCYTVYKAKFDVSLQRF